MRIVGLQCKNVLVSLLLLYNASSLECDNTVHHYQKSFAIYDARHNTAYASQMVSMCSCTAHTHGTESTPVHAAFYSHF